jgi:hypothetical protein
MKYVAAFGRFWYDFVVGDDWTIAVAVVAAVAATAVLAPVTAVAWMVLPAAVALILGVSIYRSASSTSASRRAR